MSLTFEASGFQAVPVDVPFRWSGFLERGRPRPLNPPLMQTQPVLIWFERRARRICSLGLLVPQADVARPRSSKSDHLHCRNLKSLQATAPPLG